MLDAWNDFFVAEAGAAAALTGLLFVAVSINLGRILEFAHLPSQAVSALLAFSSVLAVTTFGLAPIHDEFVVRAGIALCGALTCIAQAATLRQTLSFARKYNRGVTRVLTTLLPPLPFVLALAPAELTFALVPGVLLSFAAGLFGSWVLLIEIQR